jgi:transposase
MDLRRVINGIFYVNKTGYQWRMMPKDLGNGHTIYGYFRRWRRAGVWARVMDMLRQWERQSQGRLPEPSACCADSQSIRAATQDHDIGLDGHKKIKGRKRHILVDTLGLIVAVVVTAANTDDRLGLVALLKQYFAAVTHPVRALRCEPAACRRHPALASRWRGACGPTPGAGISGQGGSRMAWGRRTRSVEKAV